MVIFMLLPIGLRAKNKSLLTVTRNQRSQAGRQAEDFKRRKINDNNNERIP
jgi:hypothetical protein